MSNIKKDRWVVKNPEKLQTFQIGDCFSYKDQVLKIGHVSSLAGVKVDVNHGHFFTIDDTGYVEKVAPSLDELLNYFSDKDLIFKIVPTGFENGEIIYTPIYEEGC